MAHKVTSRHSAERFVGFSIDGEYVNLSILQNFLDENLIEDTASDFFEIWDPAHVIERAILDGFKKAPLLERHTKWLQEVIKEVQYGNAYEQLLKAAEKIETGLLRPRIFKSKKFVVDCEKAYRSFFNNYRAVAIALQDLMPNNNAESSFRHMTDKNFIMSVSFLSCVCSMLATFSSKFQRYDSLVNDLFNNSSQFLERLDEIVTMIEAESFSGCFYMKAFNTACDELKKGKFKGVPTVGRNTLWHHYRPLVMENMFTKFKHFIIGIKSGFVRRMANSIDNPTLQSYSGLLNQLLAATTPHLYNKDYDIEVIGKLMKIPSRNVEVLVNKLCGFICDISKSCQHVEFNQILRKMLITTSYYENLPTNVVDGIITILTIPCSEAIAETQGSSIDLLNMRYKNTDKDFKRLQAELKIRLMGPAACSPTGEELVHLIAKRMADKHSFISVNRRMGPAIRNVLNKTYTLPFKFND